MTLLALLHLLTIMVRRTLCPCSSLRSGSSPEALGRETFLCIILCMTPVPGLCMLSRLCIRMKLTMLLKLPLAIGQWEHGRLCMNVVVLVKGRLFLTKIMLVCGCTILVMTALDVLNILLRTACLLPERPAPESISMCSLLLDILDLARRGLKLSRWMTLPAPPLTS